MITDHPYIDNNGPTYMHGVCDHGMCRASVYDHSTMVRADRVGGRRRVVRAPQLLPEDREVTP